MSKSNYPNGFKNGLVVRGVPINIANPGETFWVNNSSVLVKDGIGGSNSNSGDYRKPFASIDYAIGRCTANRGDIIMVMPGHVETVETDGGLALDVAGVAIVGLGSGTLRPVVILDTDADAAITISADNCSIQNIEVRASFADVVNGFDITAAWASLDKIEFTEEGVDLNFLDYIHASSTVDGNADGLSVTNCIGTAVDAGQNSFLSIKADVNRLVVNDNVYISTHANTLAMVLVAGVKTVTNIMVMRNIFNAQAKTSGDMLIDNGAADNSGMAGFNHIHHIDTAGVVVVDCQPVAQMENYSNSTIATQGVLYPAADSVD